MKPVLNDLQKLHDRATRGETLTSEETRALENWYVEQDQAEQILNVTSSALSLAELQAQTDAVLKRLAFTTQHIQEARAVNETIRQDIALLEKQLTHQRVA